MWIRRTIWFEKDRYEAQEGADINHVIGDAVVLAANLDRPITVHVGDFPLEVEPDADPAVLRSTVEDAKKPKKAKRAKKAPVKKAAPAKKPAKKAPKKAVRKAAKRKGRGR